MHQGPAICVNRRVRSDEDGSGIGMMTDRQPAENGNAKALQMLTEQFDGVRWGIGWRAVDMADGDASDAVEMSCLDEHSQAAVELADGKSGRTR